MALEPAFNVVLLVHERALPSDELSQTPQVASTSVVPFSVMAPDATGSSAYTHAPDAGLKRAAVARALTTTQGWFMTDAKSVGIFSATTKRTQYEGDDPLTGDPLVYAAYCTFWRLPFPPTVNPFDCAYRHPVWMLFEGGELGLEGHAEYVEALVVHATPEPQVRFDALRACITEDIAAAWAAVRHASWRQYDQPTSTTIPIKPSVKGIESAIMSAAWPLVRLFLFLALIVSIGLSRTGC